MLLGHYSSCSSKCYLYIDLDTFQQKPTAQV